jgi:hypothetical protein
MAHGDSQSCSQCIRLSFDESARETRHGAGTHVTTIKTWIKKNRLK